MRINIIGGGPGGLYTAILLKKDLQARRGVDADVRVYERNRADDTFGFGVVFSDETLDGFLARDPESYGAITQAFSYWDDIDFRWRNQAGADPDAWETVRSAGHGFCGCGRMELLQILQRRCADLGIPVQYETEIDDLAPYLEADLLIGADGLNSLVRGAFEDVFQPSIDMRRNRFVWLGSDKPCSAFTFNFTESSHGMWVLGEYQYRPPRDGQPSSTWIVEAPEETWAAAAGDVENLDEPALVAWMEGLWGDYLDGYRLFGNRSVWRRFPMIRCAAWHTDNVVIIGDALHTAHYSIGSGTKLAMEDAIALTDAVVAGADVPTALADFEANRREEVEKTQHAADVSVIWTENPARYKPMPPLQAAYSMITRAKAVTHDNLRMRDEALVATIETAFADKAFADAGVSPPATAADRPIAPMFTPLRLRGLTLQNRVVVSPMDMYSAVDGAVGDFHFVHFGALAHGGAGLVMTEMVCVSAEGRITPGCSGLYSDDHIAAWKRVIDYVKGHSGAAFGVQLGHSGRKGSTRVAWDGMDLPLPDSNWPVIGPSALPHARDMHTPREMTVADMDAVTADFVASTQRADAAGADWLELHMAHGYLLSTFITPVANRRTDDYGGSLENRMRFPLAVFDAVRAIWPNDKPMSVRISATDWVGDDGVTPDEAVRIARMLKGHGCDIIDVSAGQTTPDAQPVYGRMFQTPFAEQVRLEADIPTMAVGNITTADQVNTIIAAGRADLVCLARPHLTNPHFTLQAAAWYGAEGQPWPKQYDAGRDQAFRMAARDRAELEDLRRAVKPASHGDGG